MAKTITSEALYGNITINVNVPSTVEEIDSLVGEVGAAINGFNSDCLARNYYPRLYKTLASEIESNFPALVVKTEPAKKEGDKPKDIYETDIKHVGRYYESLDAEARAVFDAHVKEVAAALPFYAEGDRSGSGRTPEWAVETANKIVAAEKVDQAVATIEGNGSGIKVNRESSGEVSVDSLARAIFLNSKWKAEQAKKSAMDELMA